ncbi:MAG: class I SAM-dependent methyltransferase [Actinomyces sp.]|nr:methyltransferase [Actinomyces sp.]MCI1641248.1 class I SAM-dependent methyltransferase [Actinomyces sp.]MCI1786869.1 class I SAM-dependent methyltransferase [Actinomyces sp.]MCI1828989.1 class I SAM-dependent methyltransferase [Actinomyces sp.]
MDDQYFTDSAPADEDELRTLTVRTRGRELRMQTSGRVFSSHRLDLGTAQLLDKAPAPPPSGRFLDLGCGWGPLAVVLALEAPRAEIWAVDVNSRAVDLTARNAAANGASGVRALPAAEAFERARRDGLRFDLIWSNPPVRIGKASLHRMLADWLALLAEGGAAYLVVQRNLGADSLRAWLDESGLPTRTVASKKGYRILEVRPGGPVRQM